LAVLAGCGSGPSNRDARTDVRDADRGGDGAVDREDSGAAETLLEAGRIDTPAADLNDGAAGSDRLQDNRADAGPGGDGASDAVSNISLCGVLGWGKTTIAAVAQGAATVGLASPDGQAKVVRASDGSTAGIDNGAFGAYAIAYAPDGGSFAACDQRGCKVWRTSDGALLSVIPEFAAAWAVALSSSATFVAAALPGNHVALHSASGTTMFTALGVTALGLSPDGTRVAATLESGGPANTCTDVAWRTSNGSVVWSMSRGSCQAAPDSRVFFSLDGSVIAFSRAPGGTHLNNVVHASDGSMVSKVLGHVFAFSSDGSSLVGDPGLLQGYGLYRVSDGIQNKTFMLAQGTVVLAAGFGVGGETHAAVVPTTGSPVQLVTDGVTPVVVPSTATNMAGASSVAISSDGSLVAAADTTGKINVWSAATRSLLLNRSQSISLANAPGVVAFAPDGASFAWCGGSSTPVESITGVPRFTLPGRSLTVAYSPSGALIATGQDDFTARLWRASDGAPVRTLVNNTGHTKSVLGLAFSPDETMVATCSADKTVKIWRVADGGEVRTINAGVGVESVEFTHDGTLLVGAEFQTFGQITVWDVSTGMVVGSARSSSNAVPAKEAGSVLVADSIGIDLLHLPELTSLGALAGSDARTFALALSGDGRTLASSTLNSPVVHLWCSP
jgi:WD40 repeat protein